MPTSSVWLSTVPARSDPVRPHARLPLEQLEPYLLVLPPEPTLLSYRAVFGNDAPVEMEVGFGKGLFLANAGKARPDVNFLGVEVERKYQLVAATRLARLGLRNIRLVRADARDFVRACIAPASLQAVHVYFPDPWWKTRHRKRRVFTEEFAAQCARMLLPGGQLFLTSDVEEYFGIMTQLLAGQPGLEQLPTPDVKSAAHDLDYLTHFERKYRKEGRPIHRAVYRRLGSLQ
jgi:tRNA (guanine-N7-)-methyltransferase